MFQLIVSKFGIGIFILDFSFFVSILYLIFYILYLQISNRNYKQKESKPMMHLQTYVKDIDTIFLATNFKVQPDQHWRVEQLKVGHFIDSRNSFELGQMIYFFLYGTFHYIKIKQNLEINTT